MCYVFFKSLPPPSGRDTLADKDRRGRGSSTSVASMGLSHEATAASAVRRRLPLLFEDHGRRRVAVAVRAAERAGGSGMGHVECARASASAASPVLVQVVASPNRAARRAPRASDR